MECRRFPTQAMWLSNPRVNPREPAQPLREAARDAAGRQDGEWVLCLHDGSRLNSRKHEAKQDRLQMTHEHDVGCELQGSLLWLAPMMARRWRSRPRTE